MTDDIDSCNLRDSQRYTNPAGVSEYSDHWAPSSLRRPELLEQPYAPPKSSEIEQDNLDTASAPCVGGQFTRWIGQGVAANRDARPPIEKRPTLSTRSRFVCWAPSASAFLSTQAGPTQTSIILVASLHPTNGAGIGGGAWTKPQRPTSRSCSLKRGSARWARWSRLARVLGLVNAYI
jgi:hypothetical protein